MKKFLKKSVYSVIGREPVHPFPARMAPGIALGILEEATKPLRVLDPMMGSGTVLAVALSKGHTTVGIDIDPLAVLISRVWITPIDPVLVSKMAIKVLDRARNIFVNMKFRNAYPHNADLETRKFLRYWFDDLSRRQLASLAIAISRVRNVLVRDALWVGFSRLIIAKQSGASLAMDLSHSRPHKSFLRAPAKPFGNFIDAVNRVAANCIHSSVGRPEPVTSLRLGDARHVPLGDECIDLVLTSPPYLNAIDYMRCSKFSLVWMGYSIGELRRLRANNIGAEIGKKALQCDQEILDIMTGLKLRPGLGNRHEAMLLRYIEDMRAVIREAARVLAPGGNAVYVVGENTIRGTLIRNSAIVTLLAQLAGLKLFKRRVRELPPNRRYLPPPEIGNNDGGLNTRMRREVILSFVKPYRR